MEELNKYLNNIKKIKSNNDAIDFIIMRFKSSAYRGIHSFQHNRFDENELYFIVKSMIDTNQEFIEIPKGDENNGKNGGFYVSDYPIYETIVQKYKREYNKGTPMTIKKNLFPDLHRAGIIKKHDEKKREIINTTGRTFYTYVSIPENVKNLDKDKLYSMLLDSFVSKYLENIYYILKETQRIDYYEFLLFFTWIDNSDINTIIKVINSWRNLTKANREAIIENLKKYMNPKEYEKVNKSKKKDWGNFNNESQQILSHLKNAKILKISKDRQISLNYTISDKDKNIININRDIKIYEEYHLINGTSKKKGYEMDHIVKFSLATTIKDIPLIDHYLNLLYIDAKTHAIKTQSHSLHMILEKNDKSDNQLILKDISNINEPLVLEIGNNVLIDKNRINEYIDHNKKILNSLN